MICDKVKECAEKMRHMPPPEKSKRNRERKTHNRIQNTAEYMDVKEAFFKRNGNIKIAEEYMVEEYDELERRK